MITWRQIPGWFDPSYQKIYRDAVASAPEDKVSHFVEVGILFGRSTAFMCNLIRESNKKIIFDAIDPFRFGASHALNHFVDLDEKNPDRDLSLRAAILRDVNNDGQLAIVNYLLTRADLRGRVNIIPVRGQDWAHRYDDESLDLVFVDALHTYEDTRENLQAFLPKVKRGALLAGHDYHQSCPGVVRAVDELLPDRKVNGISFSYRKP